VTPQGPVFGREAIEKLFTRVFQQGHYSNHLNKDDQGSPHMIGTAGDEVWRTGEWSLKRNEGQVTETGQQTE
jgi:hypothetical protein